MKQLRLIRGLPGSGKTKLAEELMRAYPGSVHAEANQFFEDDAGNFNWDSKRLKDAQYFCLDKVASAMASGVEHIIVANTFHKRSYMEPYIQLARDFGYSVDILVCSSTHENIHNVPLSTMRTMRTTFEWPVISLPG